MAKQVFTAGGQQYEVELTEEQQAWMNNPEVSAESKRTALRELVSAQRGAAQEEESPAKPAEEGPGILSRMGRAAVHGGVTAYTGLVDALVKGEGLRQASENLGYDLTNPLALAQLEAARTIPDNVTTAPVLNFLGLGDYKPEGLLERGVSFGASWLAPGFGAAGNIARGKGAEELAMALGGFGGSELGGALGGDAGAFTGTLAGALGGAAAARALPHQGDLSLQRSINPETGERGGITSIRPRPNKNARAILTETLGEIDPAKLEEMGRTRMDIQGRTGLNLSPGQLLPEEAGLNALEGYISTTGEGAPLDAMFNRQQGDFGRLLDETVTSFNPGGTTSVEAHDVLTQAALGRIALQGQRAADQTFAGNLEDWAKGLETEAGKFQTVNPPDHRPNRSDTLEHLIPQRWRDQSNPRALTAATLAQNQAKANFRRRLAGQIRAARDPDHLSQIYENELNLILNWDTVIRDADGLIVDNPHRKLPSRLRTDFETFVSKASETNANNREALDSASTAASTKYGDTSDVGRVARDKPFSYESPDSNQRSGLLAGAGQNQGTRDPIREFREDLGQLSGGNTAFATFAGDWISRKFFGAGDSRKSRVGTDEAGRPNLTGQIRTHREIGDLHQAVSGTPAQRTALIRVVEETHLARGASPQEAEAAAKGFAEFLSLMGMISHRPGVGGATRGELSRTSRQGIAGHIGAVNVMTPFRQPLMIWVRYASSQTHKAINDLLTDPAKYEQLIALARTPRRDYAEIERILTRLSKQVPNAALYDQEEAEEEQ